MSIANDIKNIYEFSKNTEDKNFKDFAESLLCFCEEQKEKININDIENFSHLIQTQFSSLDDGQNYKETLSSLIKMLEKGFIDYQEFYNNFQKHIQNKEESNNDEREDSKNTLTSELLLNLNLSKVLEAQKNIENLDKNQEINKEISNQTLSAQNNIQASKIIMPSDMIAYIKDEKNIIFPFPKESTLENKKFMKDFYRDLNQKSNDELQSLITMMRAKNEKLKTELLNLKQEKDKNLESLNEELKINSVLSEEKNTLNQTLSQLNTSLDKANQNLNKSRENYQKNKSKWYLFNHKEKINKNDEEQENKVLYRKTK